jgi:hypothetical protein
VLQGASALLQFHFSGTRVAEELRIRLNGQLLESARGPFPPGSPITRAFFLAAARQQNLLEVEASDGKEVFARAQVIFYR